MVGDIDEDEPMQRKPLFARSQSSPATPTVRITDPLGEQGVRDDEDYPYNEDAYDPSEHGGYEPVEAGRTTEYDEGTLYEDANKYDDYELDDATASEPITRRNSPEDPNGSSNAMLITNRRPNVAFTTEDPRVYSDPVSRHNSVMSLEYGADLTEETKTDDANKQPTDPYYPSGEQLQETDSHGNKSDPNHDHMAQAERMVERVLLHRSETTYRGMNLPQQESQFQSIPKDTTPKPANPSLEQDFGEDTFFNSIKGSIRRRGKPNVDTEHYLLAPFGSGGGDAQPSSIQKTEPDLPAQVVEMQGPAVGGVLSQLMKLEASRQQQEARRTARKLERAHKKQSRKSGEFRRSRPVSEVLSIANIKLSKPSSGRSSPDIPHDDKTPPKRPDFIHRSSFLSNVTQKDHMVPRLAKEKRHSRSPTPNSVSRRSSTDSLYTTDSGTEPISFEDRMRITFELASILQRHSFLCKLAEALIIYGCPSHRLESAMKQVSNALRVDAGYVYLPNCMFISFFDVETHTTETHFLRVYQGYDMHRLSEIYRLEKLVTHGEVTVEDALSYMTRIKEAPDYYPRWLTMSMYIIASFSSAFMFFGGSWPEMGLAGALGFWLSCWELVANRYASLGPIFEITMSIFVGFLARASTRGSMCFTPIAFGGVVMLLPGYTMASGIIELASRHIISGIVRMVYAIMYSFLLGYGLSMGSSIYIAIDSKAVPATQDAQCVSPNRMTAWWNWLWVPLFGFAYCIWLKARPRRFPIMIIFGGIAYTASFLLQTYANAPAQVSQFLPAFGIGLLGNLWSRLRHEMSFDGMLLGVFFLVPGSVGLRSGIALMGGEDINGSGAGFALAMIESAIGIAVGLFSATLIVYPKGTVHTPLMSF